MPTPFEKFSNNFKQALKVAADLAVELHYKVIKPEHILYGLMSQRGSVGAEIFTSLKVTPEDIKDNITKINPARTQTTTKIIPKFSESSRALIQKSIQISYINEHRYVGTEHLLAAIAETNDPTINKLFKVTHILEENLTEQVAGILKSVSKLPDLTATFKSSRPKLATKQIIESEPEEADENPIDNGSALEMFGVNLTNQKFQAHVDPVIGCDNEIERIIQILSRRTKNNPLLLGEPGVGKTAIVEGLAKKILTGDVPPVLQHKKIYAIDLTATVAGTMYRGEFENRLKQIIDEARRRPEVILFIDEIHNIVGAGSASGSMDAANILKPALARGDINCIGATTYNDYRKSIENDPALERRFQVVQIAEPTTAQAKNILLGVKKYFENFHHVKITDTAIESAVTLSQRYLPAKFLPDKAIDLIDEASSAVKIKRGLAPQELLIKNLSQQITDTQKQTRRAIFMSDYELAIKLRDEVEILNAKLKLAKEKQQKTENKLTDEITAKDIAQIITKITGIPVEALIASERKKVINLDKKLGQSIIGQDEAIRAVSDLIKRSKAGLTPAHRPLASFIFVGSSGVGKTYTAKILAETLFGDSKSLIRIDMSEYSERFNISKLIGAPAGYVGYKESGQLTEKVKHKPYAVILLDEIEKANRDVFDLLLQVLDDGYLTDASGAKINFQNTIIIMTSNIGSEHFKKGKELGFAEVGGKQRINPASMAEKVLEETKNHFKPEFINRVDKIIYFNPLSPADLEKIVKLELAKLAERIADKTIKLIFNPAVAKLIVAHDLGQMEGARSIQKTMQNLIESSLAEKLLAEEIIPGDTVHISAKNGIIKISKD